MSPNTSGDGGFYLKRVDINRVLDVLDGIFYRESLGEQGIGETEDLSLGRFPQPLPDDGWDFSLEPSVPARRPEVKSSWKVSIADGFVKDIKGVDKKLQGRILGALVEIIEGPCQVKGDTLKPLTDDLKGYWRYRIGDFRLVYKPEVREKELVLIAFDCRGNVYR